MLCGFQKRTFEVGLAIHTTDASGTLLLNPRCTSKSKVVGNLLLKVGDMIQVLNYVSKETLWKYTE